MVISKIHILLSKILNEIWWIGCRALEFAFGGIAKVISFFFHGKIYCSYPYLETRTSDKAKTILPGVDDSIIACIFCIICYGFNMSPKCKYKLRLEDKIIAIYNSWYDSTLARSDEMELETIDAMLFILSKKLSQKNLSFDCTIEDIILEISKLRNNKPVNFREKKGILLNHIYYINESNFFKN